MKEYRLENSPIVYYISGREHREWVLFIHAAFVHRGMFKSQAEYFGDKYNVMLVDIVGHGKSTKTKRGDGIDKMSGWIAEILKKENISQIHIAGVSLGAVIAQDFANKFPQKVRSLACFGGYDINNFDEKLQRENSGAQGLMMLKAVFSIKWFAQSNKKISAHTRQAQEDFYNMNIQFSKKSFKYLASMGKMINSCKPRQRDYPLLIGCGQYDIPSEIAALDMWQKSRPNCQKIIFPGAGHCVNMDTPRRFNRALENFWKK